MDQRAKRWSLGSACGLLGLALGSVSLPLLGVEPFDLGGVFPLVAAILGGPWIGLFAALVAEAPRLLGGDAIGWVGVLEATTVGWLVARRHWVPLFAALAFWSAAGVPVLIVDRFLAADGDPRTWLGVVGAPLEGLIAVLLADLVVGVAAVRRRAIRAGFPPPTPSLRRYLLRGIALVATLSLLCLAGVHWWAYEARSLDELEARLGEAADAVRRGVDGHLGRHRDAVVTLAASVRGVDDPESLARGLERVAAVYPGFLTMLATDAEGNIVAAYPRDRLDGVEDLPSVADRPYFRAPMTDGRPFLSDAFRGRGFGVDPIVAVSAPRFDAAGRPTGIVEGSLDLARLRRFEGYLPSLEGAEIAVLDSTGKVVWASPTTGLDFLDRPEDFVAGEGGPYLSARTGVETAPWTVWVRVATSVIAEPAVRVSLLTVAVVLVALGVSILLAWRIARGVTRPLDDLAASVRRLTLSGEPLTQPIRGREVPEEVERLLFDFDEMARRLVDSYRKLRDALSEQDSLNRRLHEVLADLDRQVKERTAELEVAKRRAEEANEAKSTFLAYASHEIRTPLNAVVGMTELLAASDLDADQKRRAELVIASSEALLALVDDLLDLSKIEAGKMELEEHPFELGRLVEDVVALVEPKARAQAIELRLDASPDVPPVVLGDSHRLRQILLNLLANAVKFTAEGGVTLRVRVDEDFDAGGLRFEVADTGPGLDDKARARLFRPYQQAESSISRRFGGTGLGLAISRRIVELMDGEIGVDSRPGEGATFWFRVPLAPSELIEGDEPMDSEEATLRWTGRVLLVDDNPINREVALAQLESLGLEADDAEDGEEALERLASGGFALVLMDCQMPRLDGYEATRRWREHEREAGAERVPILALTAHAMAEGLERCREAGMDEVLTKPLRLDDLRRTLERYLAA